LSITALHPIGFAGYWVMCSLAAQSQGGEERVAIAPMVIAGMTVNPCVATRLTEEWGNSMAGCSASVPLGVRMPCSSKTVIGSGPGAGAEDSGLWVAS
jgi:hypothetical protein